MEEGTSRVTGTIPSFGALADGREQKGFLPTNRLKIMRPNWSECAKESALKDPGQFFLLRERLLLG